MGIFGPSRKEKFVRTEAMSLANYLKNNAVKAGGEAYAKCQTVGILAKEINEPLLWYFWSIVYGFRIAQDGLALENVLDYETRNTLLVACMQVDNQYFQPIEHAPYEETCASMGVAAKVIKAKSGKPSYEQASTFMLLAVKAVPGLSNQDQKFTVVQMLAEAATSFPSLKTIIDQNA